MSIVDLQGREREATVEALLAAAQIHRAPEDAVERAAMIAREYAERGPLRLLGVARDGHIVAIVGIEELGGHAAIVRDLAVAPGQRRHGLGRSLLDCLRNEGGFLSLHGHTLAESSAFYARCGFTVVEDGALPDGRARYRFSWRASLPRA